MKKTEFSETMNELLDLLCELKKENGDADVAFAVSLMVVDDENAQKKVVEYIRRSKEHISLEDVCRFLNTMFEPLETSEDDADDVPA